jgi:hypothetical protein
MVSTVLEAIVSSDENRVEGVFSPVLRVPKKQFGPGPIGWFTRLDIVDAARSKLRGISRCEYRFEPFFERL